MSSQHIRQLSRTQDLPFPSPAVGEEQVTPVCSLQRAAGVRKHGRCLGEKIPFTAEPRTRLERQPVPGDTHTASSAVSKCSRLLIFKLSACADLVYVPGPRYPAGSKTAAAGLQGSRRRAVKSWTGCRWWLSEGCSDIPVPGWCVVARSRDGGSSGTSSHVRSPTC